MTKKDRQALGDYVRWAANEIGLRDWTIDLLDEPPDVPDALAEVETIPGRRRARLRICREFRG